MKKITLKNTMALATLVAGMAMLPSAANATLYTWVPDNTYPLPISLVSSSGSLEYDSINGVTDFSFTYGYFGTDNVFINDTWDVFGGTAVLSNNDLVLDGTSYDSNQFAGFPILTWAPTGWSQPDENVVAASVIGDWVATPNTPAGQGSSVPEPTTVAAAALMLLPFGASALRIMRKKQLA